MTKHRVILAIVTIAVVLVSITAAILVSLPSHHDDIASTPVASIKDAGNSSGYWAFTILDVDRNSVRFTQCEVRLTIGSDISPKIMIPSSLGMDIPINTGSATGYSMDIIDVGLQGYISAGDTFRIGPINNSTGENAFQPSGTQITLQIVFSTTGGAIVTKSFTV